MEINDSCLHLSVDGMAIEHALSRPEAFTEVFDRYFAGVHHYVARRAGRDRADDLASQTFLVAFERRCGYRDRFGSARPWLLGIATNLPAEMDALLAALQNDDSVPMSSSRDAASQRAKRRTRCSRS